MSEHLQADVVVIGMGPGGEHAAGELAEAGLDVVGIDELLVGGECPYWGCVPSKMMIRAADLLAEGHRIPGVAGTSTVVPDWAPVAARIRNEATDSWDDRVAVERFEGHGGRFVRGHGRIVGPGKVEVTGSTEGEIEVVKAIVVASGSHAAIPPIPGLAGTPFWTNRQAIEVEDLPRSLVVVGGGAIGVELAQVFARFGVDVTIIESTRYVLDHEEPEVGPIVEQALQADGITVRCGVHLEAVEHSGDSFTAVITGDERITAERLLVATGRRVNLEGVGLGNVGVDTDLHGAPVDDHLRVADGVWALGDVTNKGMFTHVSMYQAGIVVADVLGQEHEPADYKALPRVTFTDPEVGSVGLTARQAEEEGLTVRTGLAEVGSSARGWIHGGEHLGIIKVVEDADRGVVVGATTMGPSGGEVLGLLALAVHAEIPVTTLRSMIYAYPTFHRGIEDALRDLGSRGRVGTGGLLWVGTVPRVADEGLPEASVGRVIGTEDSTPLEFWVGVAPDQYLQLDDVVALERTPPGAEPVKIYGVVSQVRARHEGTTFDSDVFLVSEGLLPAKTSESALVQATRFEPELFVPPLPGQEVRRARGDERDEALAFDGMEHRLPAGLSRDDEPVFINLEFLDGTKGAHVNISGVSGVATKTTYATFLLSSLFTSGVLGAEAVNTKALIFNVKGEDLLFLDHANRALTDDDRQRYAHLGVAAGPFGDVGFFAPPRRDDPSAGPDVSSRHEGVDSFWWTIEEMCQDELLPFLFADADDDRQQYTMVVHNVTARLKKQHQPVGTDGAVTIDGETVRTFGELVDLIEARVLDEDEWAAQQWTGRAIGAGTVNAFIRRLHGSRRHLERLVRSDVKRTDRHRVGFQHQVTVVDLHNLNDRAKRFVVGVVLRKLFDEKERSGQARPIHYVVLDELNKYAPRDSSSPIKEILLDVAERGRSLGIVLIGAQQTASEVERRIVANSAIRVVGRLDSAEATRGEYGFLPAAQRQRATILKPGTMLLSQPELPVPLVVQFPFPAWATRASEAVAASNPKASRVPDDPFAGLPEDGSF